MAKKPSQAPSAVLAIRRASSRIRWPQPLRLQTIQHTSCIAITIIAPGISPPMKRSEIGRFMMKP